MIGFRPMRQGEFSSYLDYFIPDYAAEISANYGLSSPEAVVQAKREIAEDLPNGPDTSGQVLLCITDSEKENAETIGYLWYRADTDSRTAFISDFHILPACQGNGYGKQALLALEIALAREGFEQIRLRVAADNMRAQHIYKAGGFRTTGINMSKRIKAA
ncbi:GNAT family N-acetyltransferase [Phyllobacterium sp. 22229]|uniref:GNAT family N-acetyltransferase n=1 Tax=Phyllobacterium sp. 22229 TaxID=3453895 RepID=UPI003F835088